MKPIQVALDFTPNSNHAGFYVARARGYYEDAGLDVSFISPHMDGYKVTPGSRVADGSATFASCPSETLISYHTWPEGVGEPKPKVKAVATLIQGSSSAIVTLKSSGLDRPANLDGKRYASYGARFEGRIVQALIKADGGSGDYVEDTPPMLGIWNTVLQGRADATWVFMGWEGIQARRAGVELNAFSLEDFAVPYGYSPVLVAHPDTLQSDPEMVRAFLAATARGYAEAAADPAAAAQILVDQVAADTADKPLPEPLELEMVREAQEYAGKLYLRPGSGRWGEMEGPRWEAFVGWLAEGGLLTSKVQSRTGAAGTTSLDGLRSGDAGGALPAAALSAQDLFTNEFLS